jgi:hypothetical protein
MFELFRRLNAKQLAFEQLPIFLMALTIAELFYKFRSFLLETAAFLVTWYVLGALYAGLKALFAPSRTDVSR